ncbi:MAG: hypothetical protein VX325_06035 [Bacteroidota bacterium]|nr:hypothetical protein [Bacteroidota bacterium]
MKKYLGKFGFLLILIPVGLFVRYLDIKVYDGFLSSNSLKEHYSYLGALILVLFILIFVIIYFDKKSN